MNSFHSKTLYCGVYEISNSKADDKAKAEAEDEKVKGFLFLVLFLCYEYYFWFLKVDNTVSAIANGI